MEIKVKLSKEASSALSQCMTTTDPKGRTEMRKHARIMRVLKKFCATREEVMYNGVLQELTRFKEGDMLFDDIDTFKFMKECVDKRVESSVPAGMTEGYNDLDEAVTGVADELKKADVKKEEKK